MKKKFLALALALLLLASLLAITVFAIGSTEDSDTIDWGTSIFQEGAYSYPDINVQTGLYDTISVTVTNGTVSVDGGATFATTWGTTFTATGDRNEDTVAAALKQLMFKPDPGKTMRITTNLHIYQPSESELAGLTTYEIDGTTHYYMYVAVEGDKPLTWKEAYKHAADFTYKGMTGYLATITSEAENNVVVLACGDQTGAIKPAWIGATCATVNGGQKITSAEQVDLDHTNPATADEHEANAKLYYWACGPEAGQSLTYDNWNRVGVGGATVNEPNSAVADAYKNGEAYACVNYSIKTGWNDLANDNTDSIKGYVFEFSPYGDGLVESVTDVEELYDRMYYAVQWNKAVWDNASDTYTYPQVTVEPGKYSYVTVDVTKGAFKVDGAFVTSWSMALDTSKGDNAQSIVDILKTIQFKPNQGEIMDIKVTLGTSQKSTNGLPELTTYEIDGVTHYYMYVSSPKIYWVDAYKAATNYTYNGMTGYLATVTSAEENAKIVEAIQKNLTATASGQSVWISATSALVNGERITNAAMAGGEHTNPAGTSTDSATVKKYYYWASGPEAGRSLSDYNCDMWRTSTNEPNNSSGEMFASILYATDMNGPWNDLSNTNSTSIQGYVVEFSPYSNGLVGSVSCSSQLSYAPDVTVEWNEPVWTSGAYTYPNVTVADRVYYNMYLTVEDGTFSVDSETGLTNYSLELDGKSATDVQEILKNIRFTPDAGKTMNIKVTLGTSNAHSSGMQLTDLQEIEVDGTKHYYAFVPVAGLNWVEAYQTAANYTYKGMTGYLATITSDEENSAVFDASKGATNMWIAATCALVNGDRITSAEQVVLDHTNPSVAGNDVENEALYYWAAGPEAGRLLSDCGYSNWNKGGDTSNEPNNSGNEAYACMYATSTSSGGRWNDLSNSNATTIAAMTGFVVEFSIYEGSLVCSGSGETRLSSAIDLTIHHSGEVTDETFLYTVVGQTSNVTVTVALHAGESVTILGLPYDTYVVTEQSGWSWRYELVQAQTVQPNDSSRELTFTLSQNQPYWLDDSDDELINGTQD